MAGFEWQIRRELWIYSNYSCNTYNLTLWDVQTSTNNRFHPSMGRFSKKFLSFLTQNRTRVDEAPCRYVNIAPMQSSMLNLMKISRSCSKIIQRTLRPGKNWLRYSSFSVISPVKWSNLRAWPNFEHFKISHWQSATMCQKKFLKNHCRNGLRRIALDKVD